MLESLDHVLVWDLETIPDLAVCNAPRNNLSLLTVSATVSKGLRITPSGCFPSELPVRIFYSCSDRRHPR